MSALDYIDLFPPGDELPYPLFDEDGYCEACFNGHWKAHAVWCWWADVVDAVLELRWR